MPELLCPLSEEAGSVTHPAQVSFYWVSLCGCDWWDYSLHVTGLNPSLSLLHGGWAGSKAQHSNHMVGLSSDPQP